MTTHTRHNDSTKEESLDVLRARALENVFDYLAPIIAENPDAAWQSHCPTNLIYGDGMDDAWIAGQQNGEAYTAIRILKIISDSMNPVSTP